jgi:hypothetical protein
MHANAANIGNSLDEPQKQNAIRLVGDLKDAVAAAAPYYGLGPAQVPFVNPADFLFIVGDDAVYITTNFKPLTNFPNQLYFVAPGRNLRQAALNTAISTYGYTTPISISLPLSALDNSTGAIADIVPKICQDAKSRMFLTNLQIPAGYEGYEPLLRLFHADHPDPAKNVFVMMRFDNSEHHGKLYAAIKSRITEYGFKCLRADDRAYSDDLWENVVTYMLGSRVGIVIFEEINERSFNPSVAIELGFMAAHRKRFAILKDKRMTRMPTDIIGKLYKEFDTYHIAASVKAAIDDWMNDLGVQRLP